MVQPKGQVTANVRAAALQIWAEMEALASTLPFIAATISSLAAPRGKWSSLPESAYNLKVVLLPFLEGPR